MQAPDAGSGWRWRGLAASLARPSNDRTPRLADGSAGAPQRFHAIPFTSRVPTLCYAQVLRGVIGMDGQDRQDTDGIFTLTPALSLDGRGSGTATSLGSPQWRSKVGTRHTFRTGPAGALMIRLPGRQRFTEVITEVICQASKLATSQQIFPTRRSIHGHHRRTGSPRFHAA